MDLGGSSGSSKHSRTHPKVVDGSGSSKHSESDSEVVEESRSNRHSATHPDKKNYDGRRPATAKNSASSSSASSSSSDSSLEDFFQVDTIFKSKAGPTAPPKPDGDVLLARKDDENGVTSNGSTVLTSTSQVSDLTHESMLPSMSPIQSPPAVQLMERSGDYDPCRIPASVFGSKPTTPMEWSVASNESLFSIHVGNNSFSRDHFIMLGGDLRKSEELTKSGELLLFSPTPPVKIVEIEGKRDDKEKSFEPSGVADELIRHGPKKNADDRNKEKIVPLAVSLLPSTNSKQSDGSGCSTQSFEFPIKKKKKKKKKCAWPFRYCSNCSWTFCSCRWPFRYCSNRSWAFCSCTWPRCSCTCPCRYCSNCSWRFCSCTWPKCYCAWPRCHCCNCTRPRCHCCDCTWPRCHCCDCKWPSCHCCDCKWPSCHCCDCKWPSCHCCNCSRAFCYCWNCSRKGLCCFSSTILPDGMRGGSLKVASGQPTNQRKHASKCTWCNWFSCFSCRHCCSSCHRPRCSCCC